MHWATLDAKLTLCKVNPKNHRNPLRNSDVPRLPQLDNDRAQRVAILRTFTQFSKRRRHDGNQHGRDGYYHQKLN
jgi:hypothetical protein